VIVADQRGEDICVIDGEIKLQPFASIVGIDINSIPGGARKTRAVFSAHYERPKWRVSAIAGRNDRDEIEHVIDNGVTRAIHSRSGRTLFNVQATIQQLVGSLNRKCIPPNSNFV